MPDANIQRSEIQQAFAEYDRQVTINNFRVACALGAVLMPAGYLLDKYMYPDMAGGFFGIRLLCSALIGAFFAVLLTEWGRRSKAEIVAHAPGADPGAVVYDALDAAVARGADVVIADTAGRLHTKVNLMDELGKIRRVIDKRLPGAQPETLFVLDATTGQNGLAQAKAFHESVVLSGVVLTKLDSTAKGGIVFAIEDQLKVPVRFVGVGERIGDILPFDPDAFVAALFD